MKLLERITVEWDKSGGHPCIQSRLRRLALREGYDLPAICTPEALMENIQ